MTRAPVVLARAYRLALRLYPGRFRAEFGAELSLDFEDAAADAWQTGRPRDIVRFLAGISRDLAASVVRQWARTGVPAIAVIAASVTGIAATAAVKITSAPEWTPAVRPEDEELLTLLLLVGTVLLVIVVTICFTHCFLRPTRSRRRP